MEFGDPRIPERWWRKLQVKDDHWIWTGATTKGYGVAGLSRPQRTVSVHRHMLIVSLGRPLAPGAEACHARSCEFRVCVNPAHLYEGTRAQNVLDYMTLGDQPRGERHGRAVLRDSQVDEIRQATGITQVALAQEYGVCQSTISRIRNGKRRT